VGLDVFFRRDAANFLRSTATAMSGGLGLSVELLEGLSTKEQERVIRAFLLGAQCALVSVGLSFGLEAVGTSDQPSPPQVSPRLAKLLWAEIPRDR